MHYSQFKITEIVYVNYFCQKSTLKKNMHKNTEGH